MFLIVNSNNIITANADFEPNSEDCATRGEFIVEIPDAEFQSDMIGAIYNGD